MLTLLSALAFGQGFSPRQIEICDGNHLRVSWMQQLVNIPVTASYCTKDNLGAVQVYMDRDVEKYTVTSIQHDDILVVRIPSGLWSPTVDRLIVQSIYDVTVRSWQHSVNNEVFCEKTGSPIHFEQLDLHHTFNQGTWYERDEDRGELWTRASMPGGPAS